MYRVYYTYNDDPRFVDVPFSDFDEFLKDLFSDGNVQCVRVVRIYEV